MDKRALNLKWRIFAERVAEGQSLADAYIEAGFQPTTKESTYAGASRLRAEPAVRAYIGELRSVADEIAREDTAFTLAAKLKLLARIAETGADTVKEGDSIIQYHRTFKDGTTAVRLPCKLKAIKMHNELTGHSLPPPLPPVRDALSELIHAIRLDRDHRPLPTKSPKCSHPKTPEARITKPTRQKPGPISVPQSHGKIVKAELTNPSTTEETPENTNSTLTKHNNVEPPAAVQPPQPPNPLRRRSLPYGSFAPQPFPYPGDLLGRERTGITILR